MPILYKKEYAIFESIKRIFFDDKDLEHIQIFLKHNVTALIIILLAHSNCHVLTHQLPLD